jgi:hypothetical protein
MSISPVLFDKIKGLDRDPIGPLPELPQIKTLVVPGREPVL